MSHAARIAEAMERRETQPDLLVQAAIDDARAAVEEAEAARDEAAAKVRRAPHGSVKARLMAYSQATHALLIAEGAFLRLIREVGDA